MSHSFPRHSLRQRRSLKHKRKLARKNVLGPAPAIESILEAVPAKRSPFVMALADNTPSPWFQAIEESNK